MREILLYMQLAQHFRDQILDGALKPGDALPAISQVREQTGRSRQTVGRAFRVLAGEGLIVHVAGRGYYVV